MDEKLMTKDKDREITHQFVMGKTDLSLGILIYCQLITD